MSNKILEISQWLHEKGFEADMWANLSREMGGHLFLTTHPNYHWQVRPGHLQYWDTPYISLNRALELLPLSIANNQYFELHKTSHGEHSFYYQYGGLKYEDFYSSNKDPHLAALRLLKKTVEEDYVKAT